MKIALVLGLVVFSKSTENLTKSSNVQQQEWTSFKVC